MTTTPTAPSVEPDVIPILDLSGLVAGEPGAVADLAPQLERALTDIGFFFVVGHGIDWDLVRRVYAAAAQVTIPNVPGEGLIVRGPVLARALEEGLLLRAARQGFEEVAASEPLRRIIGDEGSFEPLVVYATAHSHSSVQKAALLAGFGHDNVRVVGHDDTYAMQPDALEAAIADDLAAGRTPCAVEAGRTCCTAAKARIGSLVRPTTTSSEAARETTYWRAAPAMTISVATGEWTV